MSASKQKITPKKTVRTARQSPAQQVKRTSLNRKPILWASAALLVVGGTVAALATAFAATEPLVCFSGTSEGGANGTCTLTSESTAVLNTLDGDDIADNAYAGVYYAQTPIDNKTVKDVGQLSFEYKASAGSSVVAGSPYLSVPFDNSGDGLMNGYLVIDAQHCTDGDATAGKVDVINNPSCQIVYGDISYSNWESFIASNASVVVPTDVTTRVMVNQPGEFTISNFKLGARVTDEEGPTVPTDLKYISPEVACDKKIGSITFTASWGMSTDNVAVAGYEYQAITPTNTNWEYATIINTGSATTYSGTFSQGEGAYTFRVRAYDTSNNRSGWSNECTVTYDNTPVPVAVEDCKNYGWQHYYTANNTPFKNQGQCVAYIVSSENSALHR